MADRPMLSKLTIKNLLSFGPEGVELELRPLNVLIGPNASGKSNLIDVVGLLQAAPGVGLAEGMRNAGGAGEWLWKGNEGGTRERLWKGKVVPPTARIETTVEPQEGDAYRVHQLDFSVWEGRPTVFGEEIYALDASKGDKHVIYAYDPVSGASHWRRHGLSGEGERSEITKVSGSESILSQLRGPDEYPEITYLADRFDGIAIYRGWDTGVRSPLRLPQQVDLPSGRLQADGGNFGLVLSDLIGVKNRKRVLLDQLRCANPLAEDLFVQPVLGMLQVFVRESGLGSPVPASRFSDGVLRYLCLLAILCHPEPPPLVCIEEPEIGLHPDMIHHVAELIREASQRTQIIITTHSDLLVSAFTETPEAIIVCERDQDGTHMQRLEPDKLSTWLEKYSLGEVWLSGELGGTRW